MCDTTTSKITKFNFSRFEDEDEIYTKTPKNFQSLDLDSIKSSDAEQFKFRGLETYDQTPTATGPMKIIQSGTISSSTLVLVSTSLGVGVLSLPYAFQQTGLLNGIVALLMGGFIYWWFLRVLVEASYKLGTHEFSETVSRTLGKRGAKLFQLAFIIYIIGCLINYQITAASFVTNLLVQLDYHAEEALHAHSNFSNFRVLIIALCNLACILPVSLAKSLYHLRHTSALIVGVVIYTIIIILIQAPSYIANANEADQGILWTCFNPSIFSTFAVMLFAYNCNTNLFPIRMELNSPTENRMKRICDRTISTDGFIFGVISVVSYLSFRGSTTPIITDRPALPGTTDIFMNISRILLCLSVMFSIAIRIHPCRQQILFLWGLGKEEHHHGYLNNLLTILLVSVSALIAMIFPSVYDSVTIVGGYGTVLTGILIPGMVYLASTKADRPMMKTLITYLLMILGTLMGFTAATFTLLKRLDLYRVPECGNA